MKGSVVLHPGVYVRGECLDPFRLGVTEAARLLGVDRKTLSYLVNGRAGVSAEMALRLALCFGGDAMVWLERQAKYELSRVNLRRVRVRAPYTAHRGSA